MSIKRYCVSVVLGSLLSASCFAGALGSEWLSANKGRKLAFFQYLALSPIQPPSSQPVTIYADQVANLGYVAYAQTLSEIIRERFPQQKLRVIIHHCSEDYEKINRSFRFHPDIELMLVDYDADELQKKWIEDWLDEASLIFTISTNLPGSYDKERFYINLNQLGFTGELTIKETERLNQLVLEYRQFMDLAPEDTNFINDFFMSRVRERISIIKQNPNISNLTIPAHDITRQIIAAHQDKDELSQETVELELPRKITDSQLHLGPSPMSAGILISPITRELSRTSSKIDYLQLNSLLEKTEPAVATLLDKYARTPWGEYRFYMAYMHNWLKIAEFIGIVSYLEPETTPVILANFGGDLFFTEYFTQLLAKFGIAEVHTTNAETNAEEVFRTSLSAGRSVRLIQLPQIKDQKAYASLFAFAQNPVGVTGNQSLFMAIGLGKIPHYDINLSQQRTINDFLAGFDSTGLLNPVFNNRINPEEKARAIFESEEASKDWVSNILKHKTANDAIETYVRLTLSPEPEEEQLLIEIHTLFDAGINTSENIIVHDVLVMKRFYAQLNALFGRGQSMSIQNIWEGVLLTSSKLKDPDVRRWFVGTFFQ